MRPFNGNSLMYAFNGKHQPSDNYQERSFDPIKCTFCDEPAVTVNVETVAGKTFRDPVCQHCLNDIQSEKKADGEKLIVLPLTQL